MIPWETGNHRIQGIQMIYDDLWAIEVEYPRGSALWVNSNRAVKVFTDKKSATAHARKHIPRPLQWKPIQFRMLDNGS